jgi:type VI secretion system VgrG family protein
MALLGKDTLVITPSDGGSAANQQLFQLETFQGREALGLPYRYDMTLLSANPNVPADDVLGHPLTVVINLDSGRPRFFHGVVTYFAKIGVTMTNMRYAVVVNPRLSLFDYTRNCLIFKDPASTAPAGSGGSGQTALTIVTDVLASRGFTDVESQSIKDHTYRKREFCVQYRESDLNFMQRLLEEEGIYYFFKHAVDKETLVLADSITAHKAVPDYLKVPYQPKERKQAREREHFWSLSVSRALYPKSFTTLRGYDHTSLRPHGMLYGVALSMAPQPGKQFEDYDYPGALSTDPEATMDATVRAQIDQVGHTLIEVAGNTLGLGVGDLVSLEKDPSITGDISPFWSDADFKKEYLITSASYSISINQAETGDTAGSDDPFRATYTLLDSHTQFRPQRTAHKPRIEGPQTAIVVGPHAEEIHTDSLGRVMVVFDWDRVGERFPDAPPSQPAKPPALAEQMDQEAQGAQAASTARKNSTEESPAADEARKNATQESPASQAQQNAASEGANKTAKSPQSAQSGNKPPSSSGSASPLLSTSCWVRVAQIWAGDKWGGIHIPRIGQEVVVEFLDGDPDRPLITGSVYNKDNMPPYTLPDNKTQSGIKSRSSKSGAASNFNEIRFEDLKGKEELHIQAERNMSTLVKANESLSVGGDRSVSVTGNQSVTISGKGKSPIHSSTKVTGKYDLDVSDTIHIKAPTSITLECPGSKIEMLPGKITITAGDGAKIVLDANALMQSNAGAKVLLDSNALAQSVAGSKVLLDSHVLAQSMDGSKVTLDTNATMVGTAKATVSGASEATLDGGGGKVRTTPTEVDVSAAQVQVTGSGPVSISGSPVKIN